jgi:hypothetical protein
MKLSMHFQRVDWGISNPISCDWCGRQMPMDKLRFSLRVDPLPRLIHYCLSCRAREAAGQLDAFGKSIVPIPQSGIRPCR